MAQPRGLAEAVREGARDARAVRGNPVEILLREDWRSCEATRACLWKLSR